MLHFTLLGVDATFCFNFVSHYQGKLIEVRLDNHDRSSMRRTFRAATTAIVERLGPPNTVEAPWQLRWNDGRLWVENSILTGRTLPAGRKVVSHTLSVFATFGLPRGGEEAIGANARIRDLLGALPGVRVDWVRPSADRVRFGLAVLDARTLSRLVHLACSINVPVAVEVDWSCRCRGTDPACVRYDLRVPVGEDDERLRLLEELLPRLAEEEAV